MKKFKTIFLALLFILPIGIAQADELLKDFEPESVDILNESLRKIREMAEDSETFLRDIDRNTQIQVEESSNEDAIRFDTGGTQRLMIDSTGMVGMIIENRTSDPATPVTGQIWFRTDL